MSNINKYKFSPPHDTKIVELYESLGSIHKDRERVVESDISKLKNFLNHFSFVHISKNFIAKNMNS